MAVQPLSSTLGVLAALDEIADHSPIGTSELARRLQIPRPTAQRILVTLAQAGWIIPSTSAVRRWQLGPHALTLGRAYLSTLDTGDWVRAWMEEVRAAVSETVHVSVRDGNQIVAVAVAEAPTEVLVNVRVGRAAPLWTSAGGRAIMATVSSEELESALAGGVEAEHAGIRLALEHVRQSGYSVSLGLVNPEVHAVACALPHPIGGQQAALVISAPSPRMSPARADAHGELLRSLVTASGTTS